MKVGLKDNMLTLWSGFLKPWPIPDLLPKWNLGSLGHSGTGLGKTGTASSDTVGLRGMRDRGLPHQGKV